MLMFLQTLYYLACETSINPHTFACTFNANDGLDSLTLLYTERLTRVEWTNMREQLRSHGPQNIHVKTAKPPKNMDPAWPYAMLSRMLQENRNAVSK